jgi:hypothetical protein
LTEDPPLSAIIAKSRDDALEPFRGVQRGLLAIGLLVAAAAFLARMWMSRAGSA